MSQKYKITYGKQRTIKNETHIVLSTDSKKKEWRLHVLNDKYYEVHV